MPTIEPHLDRVLRLMRERITSGEWPPGHKIPKHRELAAEYGVGMTTIRQVITIMKATDELSGHQGVGVFVTGRDE